MEISDGNIAMYQERHNCDWHTAYRALLNRREAAMRWALARQNKDTTNAD